MRVLVTSFLALAAFVSCNPSFAADTDLRTVQVSGSAEVHAEPDRAVVQLGIEARKPQLDVARAEVARGIESILKLTRDLKIDPKDVRTTRLMVQPEYDWNNTSRERRLLGYYVSRQAEIVVRNLDQLGILLERAVSAGANSVGEPRLESTRRHELEREALSLAVEDARLNAEAAARAAKATLGAVRTIDSTVSYTPPTPILNQAMLRAKASDAESSETYQAGQLTFNAAVRIQYDLISK